MTQNQNEIMYLKPALLELEVDDYNKDYASVINESSFRINLVPSEELIRLFNRFHFTRNGRFTWSRHVRYETASEVGQFIREYAQNFTPFTLVSSESKAANININQEHLNIERFIAWITLRTTLTIIGDRRLGRILETFRN